MNRLTAVIMATLIFSLFFSACQRRKCASESMNTPPSAAEQQQLWELLVSGSVTQASYEVLQYHDSGAQSVLDVLVYGEHLCGVLQLDLSRSDSLLQPLIAAKGQGYRGAVLEKPFIRAEAGDDGVRYFLIRVAGIRD